MPIGATHTTAMPCRFLNAPVCARSPGIYSYNRHTGTYTCTKPALSDSQKARIEENRRAAIVRRQPQPATIQPPKMLSEDQRARIAQKKREAAQKQALRERLEATQKQLEAAQSALVTAPTAPCGMPIFGDQQVTAQSFLPTTNSYLVEQPTNDSREYADAQQRLRIAEKR